jgi:hypothetical protein
MKEACSKAEVKKMNVQTTNNNDPCIITALMTLTLGVAIACIDPRNDGNGPNSASLLPENILYGINLFPTFIRSLIR